MPSIVNTIAIGLAYC